MSKNGPPTTPPSPKDDNTAHQFAEAILNFVGRIPPTVENESQLPAARVRAVANKAATKAALTAGTLALPPGPLGWITLLPELVAVWKIQAQMVADIAAIYGKKTYLTREQMLYCLFRHMAAQAVRDLVVRVGDRVLLRRVSLQALEGIVRKVGVRVSQRTIGKGIARWLPIAGALGVGAYAYFDTGQVAATAIDLFERNLDVDQGW
jgi:hypothetical protein